MKEVRLATCPKCTHLKYRDSNYQRLQHFCINAVLAPNITRAHTHYQPTFLQARYSDSYVIQWFRTNGKATHALTPPTIIRGLCTSSAYVPSPDDAGFLLVLRCTPRRCIPSGCLSDTDGKERNYLYGRAMEFVTPYQTVAIHPG